MPVVWSGWLLPQSPLAWVGEAVTTGSAEGRTCQLVGLEDQAHSAGQDPQTGVVLHGGRLFQLSNLHQRPARQGVQSVLIE